MRSKLTCIFAVALMGAVAANAALVARYDFGDNLWKVNITGRQWGKKQFLKLAYTDVVPPVTKLPEPPARFSGHFQYLDRAVG